MEDRNEASSLVGGRIKFERFHIADGLGRPAAFWAFYGVAYLGKLFQQIGEHRPGLLYLRY